MFQAAKARGTQILGSVSDNEGADASGHVAEVLPIHESVLRADSLLLVGRSRVCPKSGLEAFATCHAWRLCARH